VGYGVTGLPWDAAAAAALGIDWLLTASAPAGEFGRRARAAERAFVPGDEIAVRASIEAVVRVADGAGAASLEALWAVLASAPDPSAALARAAAGDVLGDVDFFELNRFLDAIAEVRAAAGGEAFEGVALPAGDAKLAAALAPGRTAQRGFYLDDAFDGELTAARILANDRQAAYDSARSALGARVARALGLDHVRDGEFTLLRAGLRGPLPPEVRVLREAPTYLACELALDEPALAALAARDAAAARVAEAEEAVRARLSRIVGEAAARLREACDGLGELDAFVGRARFAQRFACVVPEIAERRDAFSFDFARYLPLAETLAASGRAYAPISLRLEGAAVLTGPNMGGKTAALRTCGFVAACVVLGLPVPASAASVPLFDEIAWVGLARGEHQEAAGERQLLSSFGAEVVVLRDLLERRSERALVLVDEFARTTTPREGRALLVALLQVLRARGALALAATHLHGVAREAGVAHFAIVGLHALPPLSKPPLALAAALSLIGSAMDYRLRRGDEDEIDRADALALAELLGLDPDLIRRARADLRVST
jgi:hypothetical protein